MKGYWQLLLLLSATWGASYLFIKVAVEDIEPARRMAARLLIAAAVLTGYLSPRRGSASRSPSCAPPGGRARARHAQRGRSLLADAGEQHIDSSVAAIAQSTVPIFNLVIGLRFLPHERVTATRVAGLGLGVLGVAVLAGLNPVGGRAAAGTLAVVVSSISYAGAGVYGQLRVRTVRGPVLAAGSDARRRTDPAARRNRTGTDRAAGHRGDRALLAIALLGTAMAQLVLYRMLRLHGSARPSLVTYLMPASHSSTGRFLLDEPVTASVLVGSCLILLGVALASGYASLRRRVAVTAPG